MENLLIVHGLKRSGNHAIIHWMLPQARTLFFNNIIAIKPILLGRRNIPSPRDYPTWLRRKISNRSKRLDHRLASRIVVSLEDHSLSLKPFRNPPRDTTNVLIVRDAENLFASRIKKGSLINHPAYPRTLNDMLRNTIDLWKSHVQEFIGETNILEHKTSVFFNRWYSDESYRMAVSAELGLKYNDSAYSKVAVEGGGSSFDHSNFNDRNREMNVLARGPQLDGKERELLDEIISDNEIKHYDRELLRYASSAGRGRSGSRT